MPNPAERPAVLEEDEMPLDPTAVERAYLRERHRRYRRIERALDARSSHARFWIMISLLFLLTVFFALTAWHQVHETFGV